MLELFWLRASGIGLRISALRLRVEGRSSTVASYILEASNPKVTNIGGLNNKNGVWGPIMLQL